MGKSKSRNPINLTYFGDFDPTPKDCPNFSLSKKKAIFAVYVLVDRLDNTVRYVGKTFQPEHAHLQDDDDMENPELYAWMEKISFQFDAKIVGKGNVSEWERVEKAWIAYFSRRGLLYNKHEGGKPVQRYQPVKTEFDLSTLRLPNPEQFPVIEPLPSPTNKRKRIYVPKPKPEKLEPPKPVKRKPKKTPAYLLRMRNVNVKMTPSDHYGVLSRQEFNGAIVPHRGSSDTVEKRPAQWSKDNDD